VCLLSTVQIDTSPSQRPGILSIIINLVCRGAQPSSPGQQSPDRQNDIWRVQIYSIPHLSSICSAML
jgi:hypothetical protein